MNDGKKPLTLAIIIPVYNERRHLKECLDSIKKQTTKPDEVIVVDNNSNDDSAEIAKKYQFVRVVSEKKQGIVFARNTGFNTAKSDILGRIDADTVLPKDWVDHILEFYSLPNHVDHAWTGGGIFRNTRMPIIFGWLLSQVAYRLNRLLMGHYILWGSNMAIKRNQWKSIRKKVCMDNNIHEDLDLAIHLHRQGFIITYEAFFRVSVIMRRVYIPNKLKVRLLMWPETLKKHNIRNWRIGWIGAMFFYAFHPFPWIVSKDKKFFYD